MKVGRPHPPGSRGIGTRLDGLEAVPTFRVGGLDGEAVEVGIERSRIRVARMVVAPVRVGLPELHPGVPHGLPFDVEDAHFKEVAKVPFNRNCPGRLSGSPVTHIGGQG